MAELTDNINYLQPTGFKIIMDRKNFGNVTFFATSVLHPSVTLTGAIVPFKRVDVRMPGDKLTFSELQCNIILDEDMNSYTEILNWLTNLVQQNQKSPYDRESSELPTTADITVLALTNKNTVAKKIKYYDAIPTDLGSVQFETIGGDQFITFPVSFAYSYFEIV